MKSPRAARMSCFLVLLVSLASAVPAAAVGFGKNKVQYEPLEWSVLQTPHVRLHYYAHEESLARRLAVVAESVCVEFDARFRLQPRHEVPLLLFGAHHTFQQTNATPGMISEGTGGLTELIKGRVLVPHNGSWNRLVWVTRHELAHWYMLEKISAVMKANRRGQVYLPPLWFIEGLAEYLGTTWDADAEGLMRDAILSDRALPLTRSEPITGTVLMYKEGQSFMLHLAERFGPDKPFEMLEQWYQADDFETLFRITTGETLREADQRWFDRVRRHYLPQIAVTDRLEDYAERLPMHGRFTLGPRVLPTPAADSTLRVCYFSADEGWIDLRVNETRPNGARRDTRLVRSGANPTFESLHLFQNRPGASRSGLVVLAAKRGGRDAVYLLGERGRIVRKLESEHLVGILDPCVPPGDSSVVFSAQDRGGRMDLYRWTWPGGKSRLERLTNDDFDDLEPSASPDGRWIAFASDRGVAGGHHALFRLSLEDGHIQPFGAPLSGEDRQPVYSPDGRWIAFRSTRGGTSDLWLRPAEPSDEVRRVTRARGPVLDPDWLPDGHGLVFVAQDAIEFQVWRTNFDPDTLKPEPPATPAVALTGLGSPPQPTAALDPALATAPIAPSDTIRFTGFGRAPELVPPAGVHEGPSLAYERRLGLDLFSNAFGYDPAYGGGAGTQLAFSDVLGNEQFVVTLNNSAERFGSFWDNWEGGITYINQGRRLHYGLGLFRLTQTYDPDLNAIVREPRYGVMGLVAYPFNKFVRVEGTAVVRHASQHRLRNGDVRNLDLVSNSLALVHDNTVWTRMGPSRGSRWYVAGSYTRDVTSGEGSYATAAAEYRGYLQPLPLVVLATRAVGHSSFGPDAPVSYLGGVYTLRGYAWQALSGTHTLALQEEIRTPILRGVVLGVPGNWQLPTISAAAFADAGWAWDRIGKRQLGSAGLGIMLGGGVFPSIRWNWCWRSVDLRRLEPRPVRQFLIAYDF
jgi:hypothetical protein